MQTKAEEIASSLADVIAFLEEVKDLRCMGLPGKLGLCSECIAHNLTKAQAALTELQKYGSRKGKG